MGNECSRSLRKLNLLAASFLHSGSAERLLTGEDSYLVVEFPDFRAYRDIVFWFKYALCTDLRVFPQGSFSQSQATLRWELERGKYYVRALGKILLQPPEGKINPSADGRRWQSSAAASNHTKSPTTCEDDLLYMRTGKHF